VPLLTKPQAPAAILEMLAQMIAARADAAKRALPPKT
jgi:hypothetical protein